MATETGGGDGGEGLGSWERIFPPPLSWKKIQGKCQIAKYFYEGFLRYRKREREMKAFAI